MVTRDLYKMLHAWDHLEVGGVVVGDVPSWRVDNMPYGGVKDSGVDPMNEYAWPLPIDPLCDTETV